MADKKWHQYQNNLHKWLPAQCERAGISLERLSQLAEVSRASLYKWMADDDRPSEEAMQRVCSALGVDLIEGMNQYTPKKRGRPRGAK